MNSYKTTSRRLEEFFWCHLIAAKEQYKNVAGQTVWVYDDTARLRNILAEYEEIHRQALHDHRLE